MAKLPGNIWRLTQKPGPTLVISLSNLQHNWNLEFDYPKSRNYKKKTGFLPKWWWVNFWVQALQNFCHMLNLVPIRRGWYTAIKESFLFRALCCFDWPLSQFRVICSIWSYTEENGLLPLKNLWTSGLSSALVVPCLHAPFWGASPKRVSIRVDLCVILYSFVHPSPLDLRPPRGWVWPPKGQLRLLGSLQSLTQAALWHANAFHGLGKASHGLA